MEEGWGTWASVALRKLSSPLPLCLAQTCVTPTCLLWGWLGVWEQ